MTAAFASLLSLQVGAAFAKTIFPLVGPEGVAALRIGITALILGLMIRPWTLKIERSAFPNVIMYGGMIGLMNILIYRAFHPSFRS
jgi:inner membrane transporter RhtA